MRDSRELQPIGRSAIDAIGSSEVDSDPGEETIDPADLEAASPAVAGESGGVSLGAIPGSPRPGFGRNRAQKRRPDLPSPVLNNGSRAPRAANNEQTPKGGNINAKGSDGRGVPVVMQSGHRLRYCKTCNMHQPLRTKHCRDCGKCVRTHDHHCPWVGVCIGEGNRLYFYWFLAAQFLELLVFLVEGSLSLLQYGLHIPTWLNRSPGLLLGMFVMAFLEMMVACLLCFHSYLAMSAMTTWENMSWHNISYLRSSMPEEGSPFSLSIRANLASYCCPPWCPILPCLGPSPIKRTEEGYAIWELGEPRAPLRCECGGGLNPCACFDAG